MKKMIDLSSEEIVEREKFYSIRDRCGVNEMISSMIVFGTMKELKKKALEGLETLEQNYEFKLGNIVECFKDSKGWFAGACGEEVLEALDNLEDYGLVKQIRQDENGPSYGLV